MTVGRYVSYANYIPTYFVKDYQIDKKCAQKQTKNT